MDVVTIIALILIAAFAVLGFRDGVVRRLLEVVGALVTIVLTARFAASLTPEIVDLTGWSTGASLVTAWIVLILAGLVLSRLLAVLISRLLRLTILGWLDRLGGAVCGAVVGLFVASLFMTALAHVPGAGELYARSQDGAPGRFIAGAAPTIARQARLLAGDRFPELWRQVSDDVEEKVGEATDEAKARLEAARDDAKP